MERTGVYKGGDTMRKITIESLYADDKKLYPKYRVISRKVAKRLCNDLEVYKDLPKLGYEKILGMLGKM